LTCGSPPAFVPAVELYVQHLEGVSFLTIFNTFELYLFNTNLVVLNRGERNRLAEEDQRVGLKHMWF
jgi:hypothetical protein